MAETNRHANDETLAGHKRDRANSQQDTSSCCEGPFSHTRRDHLKGILGGSAMLAGLPGIGIASDDFEDIDFEEVTATRGTNIALTATDDEIVMDLHGFLFRVSLDGGQAERLTNVELEPARPDYSPESDRIAFQGYAGGEFNIWTIALDGSDAQQVTDTRWDDREPQWSPNGTRIAFASDREETYDIWTVDIETGDLQQWTDNDRENFEPAWSPNGNELAYISDPSGEEGDNDNDDRPLQIEAVTEDGDTRTIVAAEEGETFDSPSWSPDGEAIAYVRRTDREGLAQAIELMIDGEPVSESDDVVVFTPHWLSTDEVLYSADGKIRSYDRATDEIADIPFEADFAVPDVDFETKSYIHEQDDGGARDVQGILTPRLHPDGDHIAFVALNDLWVMEIGDEPEQITDDQWYQADPAWSPDGRYLAYSSDKAGTQEVFIYDMDTETHRRVTNIDDAVVSTAWSPDGSQIAYQNQWRETYTLEVDITEDEIETGEPQQWT
jgi:Tol biopolymer transport system component